MKNYQIKSCKLLFALLLLIPFKVLFAQVSVINNIQDVTCFGKSDGAINLTVSGSHGPFSFQWSNGATTEDIANIPSDSFTVIITDTLQNAFTFTYFVNEPDSFYLLPSGTTIICENTCNGYIQLSASGGTIPYQYAWNNGSNLPEQIFLCPGNYEITTTDANGCTISTVISILDTANNLNIVSTQKIDVNCANDCNGSIEVLVNNLTPLSYYVWNDGQTGSTINGLCAGFYTVSVINEFGCFDSASIEIDIISNLAIVSIDTVQTDCIIPDGVISVSNVSGGTAPILYSLDGNNYQNSSIFNNLNSGNYTVYVKDSNNCVVTENVLIDTKNGPHIFLDYLQNIGCSINSSGFIDIEVISNTPVVSFQWSHGVFTEDVYVGEGNYSVTATNAIGCKDSANYTINSQINSFNIAASVRNNLCGFTTNQGSIIISSFGGTPPYTYLWSNGMTTNGISNLINGGYCVTVTDANGCSKKGCYEIESGTCFNVSGSVYIDLNNNCVYDSLDLPVANQLIGYGGFLYNTNQNGEYNFNIDVNDDTIVVQHFNAQANSFLSPTCNNTGTISLSNTTSYSNIDFPYIANNLGDLMVISACNGRARIGMYSRNDAGIYNYSSNAASGTLIITIDSNLTNINFVNQQPDSISGNNYFFNFNIAAGYGIGQDFSFVYELPITTTLTIGNSVNIQYKIIPSSNDIFLADNEYTCTIPVTNSYDPNDKRVSPEDVIESDENRLLYTIRFQNTGNDTAYVVIIIDTISRFLEPSTITYVNSSHKCEITLEQDSILVFSFYDIYLPDSFVNSIASNGYVQFYIERKTPLIRGTVIQNTAAIYFDFNAPIITNTVNTIVGPLTAISISKEKTNLIVFPNPSENIFYFDLDNAINKIDKIVITDIHGKEILTTNESTINLEKYANGLYFYEVTDSYKNKFLGKILKQ